MVAWPRWPPKRSLWVAYVQKCPTHVFCLHDAVTALSCALSSQLTHVCRLSDSSTPLKLHVLLFCGIRCLRMPPLLHLSLLYQHIREWNIKIHNQTDSKTDSCVFRVDVHKEPCREQRHLPEGAALPPCDMMNPIPLEAGIISRSFSSLQAGKVAWASQNLLWGRGLLEASRSMEH